MKDQMPPCQISMQSNKKFLALGTFNKTDALSRSMPASLVFPAAICITSKEGEFVRKQKKEDKRIYGTPLSSVIN